ncbi:MAG TPA: hypothetical protein DIC30_06600 [Oceanospirillales bacterium]|jgi:hypothetical protein|nr:hypothetical protein [Oleispira sp.]HCM05663.1 hypothetical protein [Oceanospirillales bacterium]
MYCCLSLKRVNEGPIALHFVWSVKQLVLNEPGLLLLLALISVIIFISANQYYASLILFLLSG